MRHRHLVAPCASVSSALVALGTLLLPLPGLAQQATLSLSGQHALDVLQWEVGFLRTAPPAFLRRVEGPWLLQQVARDDHLFTLRDPDGPWWAVDLLLLCPVGSPYCAYSQEYRVRITLDKRWPKHPPIGARFLTAIDHFYVDPEDSNELRFPLEQLFAAAPGPGSLPRHVVKESLLARRHGLLAGAHRLHFALGGPLIPLSEDASEMWNVLLQAHAQRSAAVAAYIPWRVHPALFVENSWNDGWLDPRLRSALIEDEKARQQFLEADPSFGARSGPLQRLATEVLPGVFEVPALAPGFRNALREELEGFSAKAHALGMTPRRPNNHHKFGAITGDVGLESLMLALLWRVVLPLARSLFPMEGAELDGQHSFFVRYRLDQDIHLDSHHDDSEVTFNVALDGDDPEGAELHFCGLLGDPDHRQWRSSYKHRPGYAVLHLGRHRHGVSRITAGERQGLIIWGRSSAWRRAGQGSYQREQSPPDYRCLSYTHDIDYTTYKEHPAEAADAAQNAWCPPPGFEYDPAASRPVQ